MPRQGTRPAALPHAAPLPNLLPADCAFQSCYTLLKDIVCRVHDAGIDVAELLQPEEPPGMAGVMKNIRSGLIDGHGALTRGWVGHLAGVDCERGKLLLRFGHDRLLDRWLRWWTWLMDASRTSCGPRKKQNGPNPLRTRAAWLQDRLRLAHSPLKSRTDRSAAHTHAHGHDRNSVIP